MTRRNIFRAAALLLPVWLAVSGGGCMRDVETVRPAAEAQTDEYYLVFEPIKNYNLGLLAPEKPAFAPHREAMLTLQLINRAEQTITLDEWYLKEADNIQLHIRQWHPGETPEDAAAAEWFEIAPDFTPGKPPERLPLTLAPGNRVFIDVPLAFIEELPPDTNAVFLAYAELNLTQVSVFSDMFMIEVRSEESGTK